MATLPDIDTVLYDLLVADTGVTDLVSTRVYRHRAPQDGSLPYVLFYRAAGGIPNNIPRNTIDFDYRIEGVANTSGSAAAIRDALFTALHEIELTISGWSNHWCAVNATYEILDTEDGIDYWQYGIEVNIRASLDTVVVAGGATLPTLTGEIAGWSVHENYAAKVFQDTGKTTLAASDGDVIGAVVPLTGAVDATQGTTPAKPLLKTGANGINGHWAAQFDGTDDFWDITGVTASSGPKTYYVVYLPTVIAATKQYLVETLAGRQTVYHLGLTSGKAGFYNGTGFVDVADATTDAQIMSWILGASSGEMFRNGTSIGTGTSASLAFGSTSSIGARYNGAAEFYNGLIGEIHVYNAEHSTSERQEMEAYLSSLWGITVA